MPNSRERTPEEITAERRANELIALRINSILIGGSGPCDPWIAAIGQELPRREGIITIGGDTRLLTSHQESATLYSYK